MAAAERDGLYLMLLSIHGLVRGYDMELGRDPDTGGQVKYVVELARTLARHPRVRRVDLLTRQIFGKEPSYGVPLEPLSENAFIVRIPCGPKRYLRKERLWPYLDSFTDQTLHHIRQVGRLPDIIHGHYADAGYVGAQLARLLGVPFIFTGHSLGRVKQQHLLEGSASRESLEKKFSFRRRFEAEELALDTAALVVASTHQEIEEQYKLYDHYVPQRMKVIPPGVDLSRFSPPAKDEQLPGYFDELKRFLHDPDKPIALAIARPDEKKNFATLVRAFGESRELREAANLVVIAGNRDNLAAMPTSARRVLRNLMLLIDSYDLYGSIAYPKQHHPDQIPDLYRIAARTGGVFVNPAFNEPFGLTLIEAAASGLPIIATNDGGPRDILTACNNGVLIDPHDPGGIAAAILSAVTDKEQWRTWSENGLRGSYERFSWESHVESYLNEINELLEGTRPENYNPVEVRRSRLTVIDRILATNIDEVLTSDTEALAAFLAELKRTGDHIGFCLITGRPAEHAMATLMELGIPMPDVLIASVGSEIYYGRWLVPDRAWQKHIDYKWLPDAVTAAMAELEGIELQPDSEQSRFKISYRRVSDRSPRRREVVRHLRQKGIRANVLVTAHTYIDVLPIRNSAGLALRYLTFKWGVPPERLLIAGSTTLDEQMLSGNTLGVVVKPYSPELKHLRGQPRIYFTEREYAWGLLEGITHYDFFGKINLPADEEEPMPLPAIGEEARSAPAQLVPARPE